MAARITFDSSEYHAALGAWDGVHCLECGAVLPLREERTPKPSPLSVLSKCCNKDCKEEFLTRTLHNWAELRLKAIKRDSYTCQDCGYQAPYGYSPARIGKYSSWPAKHWRTDKGLEVHHIIPISEGGPEFDLDNLITLCYDCHHLGRHGSKAPTPEEVAQKRGEERQKAEQERLATIRARHTCLDRFAEAMP